MNSSFHINRIEGAGLLGSTLVVYLKWHVWRKSLVWCLPLYSTLCIPALDPNWSPQSRHSAARSSSGCAYKVVSVGLSLLSNDENCNSFVEGNQGKDRLRLLSCRLGTNASMAWIMTLLPLHWVSVDGRLSWIEGLIERQWFRPGVKLWLSAAIRYGLTSWRVTGFFLEERITLFDWALATKLPREELVKAGTEILLRSLFGIRSCRGG